MALIQWEPRRELEPFRGLREEVDRLFESFFRGWPGRWSTQGTVSSEGKFVPSVNLKENDKEFVLTAELPGLQKDELDVNITDDAVAIKGERKEEKEQKEKSYYFKESSHGTFQRVIPLPDKVEAEKAKAKLKDGVLTLTLPKAEPSKRNAVQIDVE
jgi:HSP20 family protein